MKRMTKYFLWIVALFAIAFQYVVADRQANTSDRPKTYGDYWFGEKTVGSVITFSGADSQDRLPGTTQRRWKWDFDYDGHTKVWEKETTSPYVTWTYTQPGTYKILEIFYDDNGEEGNVHSTSITITASPAPTQYTLIVNATNGTVTKNPNQSTYSSGTNVQLTATPATGYTFTSWSGDASGTTNPLIVTMNGNKNITANFALIQPPYTNISPTSLSFNSSGGSANVTVSSNTSWYVSTSNGWISTSGGGSGNGSITITCAENTSTLARNGSVGVSGAGYISVSQEGVPLLPTLTASPSSISLPYTSGSTTINITSNLNWGIRYCGSIINSVSPPKGLNNSNVTVNYEANASTNSRSEIITVTGGGITRLISVTQDGAPPPPPKMMTISLNGHPYQVRDFISDTLNKIYASQSADLSLKISNKTGEMATSVQVYVPTTISAINLSQDVLGHGTIEIRLNAVKDNFDIGLCRFDTQFDLVCTADLSTVANTLDYSLAISNCQVNARNFLIDKSQPISGWLWFLSPICKGMALGIVLADMYYMTFADNLIMKFSNKVFPLFKYTEISANANQQLIQEIINSFPTNLTFSNDALGNLVFGMNFMEGTFPGDKSFTSINPPAPTNTNFDYLGFACPYYTFQGAFSNWTTNQPPGYGDTLAMETLLLNYMNSYSTPSIRVPISQKEVLGDLPFLSKDTSLLHGAFLDAAIRAIPEKNWARTDSVINRAQRMGFDVVPQLMQNGWGLIATMKGKAMAPDNSGGNPPDTNYISIDGSTYLYHAKIFAHAAVRRYANRISLWAIEAELDAAKYNYAARWWRFGNLWADDNVGGFQDQYWKVLVDAVRQEDPTAKLTSPFHILNMVKGLQRFAPDLDIVGVNIYPNFQLAFPVYGFMVGEAVWATRRALIGLGLTTNKWGNPIDVHVTETSYPGEIDDPNIDPPSGTSISKNIMYFSYGRQAQFMQQAIQTSLAYGAKGFFWWGFLDQDAPSSDGTEPHTNYGSLIAKDIIPIKFKLAASAFQGKATSTSVYPGKTTVTLTNRSILNPTGNFGGLVALAAERDSLISGNNLVYAIKNRTHISQTYQQNLQGLKHQSWGTTYAPDAAQFYLKQNFMPTLTSTPRDAYFAGTQPASFSLTFVDIGGQSNGTLSYQDPWFVDANGNQSNTTFRNIPLAPSFSDNVFLNQGGPVNNWAPPYYSIRAAQTQTITVNGQNYLAYFQNWNSKGATVAQPNNDTTAVVFNHAGDTITANYKVKLGSNNPQVTRGKNQRLVAAVEEGKTFVYQSVGEIYASEGPTSIQYGGADVRISLGNGSNMNPSIIKCAYDQYYNTMCSYVTWERISGNTHSIYFAKSTFVYPTPNIVVWESPKIIASWTCSANETAVNPVVSLVSNYPSFTTSTPPLALFIIYGKNILKSTNEGLTWASDGMLNGSNASIDYGALPSQPLHVVYTDSAKLHLQRRFYRASFDYNTPWQDRGIVPGSNWVNFSGEPNFTSNICVNPQIATYGNRTYISWSQIQNCTHRHVYAVAQSVDTSNNWSIVSAYEVNPNADFGDPTILGDSRGVMFWSEDNSTKKVIENADHSFGIVEDIGTGKYPTVEIACDWNGGPTYAILLTTQGTDPLYSIIWNADATLEKRSNTVSAKKGVQARMLSVTDNLTHQTLSIQIDEPSLSGERIPLVDINGLTTGITKDNFTKYIASSPFLLRGDNDTLRFGLTFSSGGLKSAQSLCINFELDGAINKLATVQVDPRKADTTVFFIIPLQRLSRKMATLSVSGLSLDSLGNDLSFNITNLYKSNGLESNASNGQFITFTSLVPVKFDLAQNYPNPFNPSTIIDYQISEASRITLKIYDILGREVAVLADGMKEAGYYTTTFNASRLASGVYFARYVAQPNSGNQSFTKTMKMQLVK
jgi:uncharacterized repeat protein (TIGR02543 family)